VQKDMTEKANHSGLFFLKNAVFPAKKDLVLVTVVTVRKSNGDSITTRFY